MVCVNSSIQKPCVHKSLVEGQISDKIMVRNLFDDGNAFSILGKCRRAARKAGWTEDQWDVFRQEACNGDYDHLLLAVMKVFDEASDEEWWYGV